MADRVVEPVVIPGGDAVEALSPHAKEVSKWLKANSLEEYQPLFLSHGYDDLEVIKEMSEEEIKQMGVTKPGHVKKFLLLFNKLKMGPGGPSSPSMMAPPIMSSFSPYSPPLTHWAEKTPAMSFEEGGKVAVKTNDNDFYQMVIGNVSYSSGTVYWEVEVSVFPWTNSGFVCFGVLNNKAPLQKTNGNSKGLIGEFASGWGYYGDGDRCHDNKWVNPKGPEVKQGDRIGILLEFRSNGNADIWFYRNGSCITVSPSGEALGFKNVGPGPLWPVASAMKMGTKLRLLGNMSDRAPSFRPSHHSSS